MIVFKTFLKILNRNKFIIFLYTFLLIGFGAFNMKTSDSNIHFMASKPDIMIVNFDKEEGITKNLIEYIKKNSNLVDLKNKKEAIDDGLFYRDVNYVIYIPKGYHQDFMNGKNPEIQIKSTGDYQSSYAEMLLTRYLKVANIYQKVTQDEQMIIEKVNEILTQEVEVEMTSKLDINGLKEATFYYNFASYSILACLIYVICLILACFKEEKIRKRTSISCMNYKKHNRYLLLSNCLFSIGLWFFYNILSVILVGDVLFSKQGIIYVINSFLLTICSTTLAFLIGNLLSNKEAINGIVNVIALGSSFLCGAFVPMEWLPNSVLMIARLLPSYYYIHTNEILTTLEIWNMKSMKPIFFNMGMIILFSIIFILLTNFMTRKKRKFG